MATRGRRRTSSAPRLAAAARPMRAGVSSSPARIRALAGAEVAAGGPDEARRAGPPAMRISSPSRSTISCIDDPVGAGRHDAAGGDPHRRPGRHATRRTAPLRELADHRQPRAGDGVVRRAPHSRPSPRPDRAAGRAWRRRRRRACGRRIGDAAASRLRAARRPASSSARASSSEIMVIAAASRPICRRSCRPARCLDRIARSTPSACRRGSGRRPRPRSAPPSRRRYGRASAPRR